MAGTYSVYEQDKNYQQVLTSYFTTREILERGVKKGVFDLLQLKNRLINCRMTLKIRLKHSVKQNRRN